MELELEVDMTLCEDHAQCCFMAPDVFELDGDGRLRVQTTSPDPALRADVEDAADACPVQAIRVTVRGD